MFLRFTLKKFKFHSSKGREQFFISLVSPNVSFSILNITLRSVGFPRRNICNKIKF